MVAELVQRQLTKQKALKGAVMNAVVPNRTINQLGNSGKIKSERLRLKAIIYIRQSTLQRGDSHVSYMGVQSCSINMERLLIIRTRTF